MNKLIWIDENTSITDKDYKKLVWCGIIGVWTIIGVISWVLCKFIDWAFDFDWKSLFKKRVKEQEETES